jgi:hypothetical protein
MASRAQSSFRAQSEWDTPKDQKRSEWDAGGGAGRKSSVKGGGNANGLTGPAQVQAKKVLAKKHHDLNVFAASQAADNEF